MALKRIRDKETNSDEQVDNMAAVSRSETPEELYLENDKINASDKKLAKGRKLRRRITKAEIDLPKGTTLVKVADTDWQVEDVGPALQFLEFCNAFSKVLDLKDGEPEYLLRDLARGRLLRQVGCSSILHFLTKLVSLIREEMDERCISFHTESDGSWLLNVVKVIDKSESASEKFDYFSENPMDFNSLNTSKKLRVLNFLCDEALQTEKLRNWMESENKKYIEQKKEMKKINSEAKKKGDDLKKKMKDDVAKAKHTVKDEVPFSVTEQSSLISEIKEESGKAHAKMLETGGTLPKNKRRRDAMRTDPVLCEEEGRVYWELEGYCNNFKIILQDVGNLSSTILQDRWLSYNQEEEKIIEKHISSTRRKRRWARKIVEDMDDDHVQGYKSDNAAGDDHHARGSEFVNIASNDQARVCESGNVADDDHAMCSEHVNVADDDHATCSEPVKVVGDDHAICCESVNVPDDGHATCLEPGNAVGDDRTVRCESVNVPDDDYATCSESVNVAGASVDVPGDDYATCFESFNVAGDDLGMCCESFNVACDDQARYLATPSIPSPSLKSMSKQ